MILERAVNEDIEQLTELRIAYLTEDNGELSREDILTIRRNLPTYFKKNLNESIFGYVARNGQEIVSCALLLVVEKPMSPAFMTGKTGTVLNVYTKEEHRHNGYAGKLMRMLLEDAVNMKLDVVELKATEAGYSLYQSLGFQDVLSKYHAMKWCNQVKTM